jgi:hypothetical protein
MFDQMTYRLTHDDGDVDLPTFVHASIRLIGYYPLLNGTMPLEWDNMGELTYL